MKHRIIIISLISLILLVGCELRKNSITSTDFNKVLIDKDYILTNVSKNFKDYENVNEAFIAQDETKTYQIEFYSFNTKDNTNNFFNNNVKQFKDNKNIEVSESEEGLNYKFYKQNTLSKYSVISCVDNTCLYANVPISKEEEINKILEKFNY